MDRVDCVVIGAGVVGLAVARKLARSGHDTVIVEEAETFGTGTSSRNSEVIHAGIYYPPGSLKASLCVSGRERLYRYCAEHQVAHRRCGKLIVAVAEAQRNQLQQIRSQANANGVLDLRELSISEAKALEPEVTCVAALFSPSTGIIDSHALMLAYLGDAENDGAMIAFRSPVSGGHITGRGIQLEIGGLGASRIEADMVVNSAGLNAQRVASCIAGFPPDRIPPTYYAKGNYFTLSGRSPFSHLVYPIPESAGLGVHVTIDLGGNARFGPDVEWIPAINYDVDPGRAEGFYRAIRNYWPGLKDGALQPGYSGIRPKIQAPGEPARDFLIQGPADHGVPGLVNLYGIESPGLTASLAIADYVFGLLRAS